MLSGSQDGSIKFWDIRDTSSSVVTFLGNSAEVRDVQFSPFWPNFFVAVFDNGSIQLWDIRKTSSCTQRIHGHDGPVLSVDWHPEDKMMIATGGRDRLVKVWNLNNGTSKPTNTVQTIASVSRVKWRPNHPYQIASCSWAMDSMIHIWDIQKHFIPLATFTDHKDVASTLLFHKDNDSKLLSSSKDSSMVLNYVDEAYKPYENINTSSLSWNIHQNIAAICDPVDREVQAGTSSPQLVHSLFGLTSSLSEDGGVNSIASASSRDSRSTFSEQDKMGNMIITNVNAHQIRQSHQSIFSPEAFQFLATNYRLIPNEGESLKDLCTYNAEVAKAALQPHISHTWHMLMMFHEFRQLEEATVQDISTRIQPNKTLVVDHDDISSQLLESGHPLRSDSTALPTPLSLVQVLNGGGNTRTQSTEVASLPSSTRLNRKRNTLDLQIIADDVSSNNFDFDNGMAGGANDTLSDPYLTEFDFTNDASTGEGSQQLQMTTSRNGSNLNNGLSRDSLSTHLSSNPSSSVHNNRSFSVDAVDVSDQLKELGVNQLSSYLLMNSSVLNSLFLDTDSQILDTLQHYSEQGDVQTCVTLCIAMDEALPVHNDEMKSQIRAWTSAYLELLQRFQLHHVATEVINHSKDEKIRALNLAGSRIESMCAKCKKALNHTGRYCKSCKSVKKCSLCNAPVKGMFVWCDGCGHGGHLKHIKEWFSEQGVCPSGCGHQCDFEKLFDK
eukprot:TRINITY_DN1197_c0_g1_i4.p1 TRINITY_DN1197_c0_g1~~TRINITY_DN1197_c0_g1_i4.p1  ORF type:complete len:724 (+),score=210.90 TRINITY_DN1197_c0_g1_i4:452-2623(+)